MARKPTYEKLEQRVKELEREVVERRRAEGALQDSKRLIELLLDSLPHPAMLIRRERTVLSANRFAREVGARVGGYCWRDFFQSDYIPDDHKRYINEHKGNTPPGGTKCTFCLADEALEANKPTNAPEFKAFGKLWDAWWVPIENDVYLHYAINITEHKRAEEALKAREKELQVKTSNLEEANTALKVLLNKRDEDRKELEEKVKLNMKWMVLPYLEKMKKSGLNERQETYRDIVESLLNDITSPFVRKLSSQDLNFTPTEIQVANLVKEGKTTKEVTELLNSSTRAVGFHRENLRKKLGLKNKKTNLRSYLLSLP